MIWEDQRMLVTPLPGTDPRTVLDALQHVYNGAVTARAAGGGDNLLRYDAYHGWALDAVRVLRGQIAPADLEQLVMTRTFWALQTPGISGLWYIARLVDIELDDRVSVLEAACKDYDAQLARWWRDEVFVVADTSFYIQHPQEMADLDLREHLGLRDQRIHLLVPILVVDELDSLKQAKEGNVRGRARRTLAIIDRVLSDPTAWGVLRREDFSPLQVGGIPRGEMTVELVLDPPGHVRLPINDDELVDRTVAFQALAGQKITMITYDTGRSTRARAAGLRAVKIAQPPEGDEP
jgi:hypothetical protein